MLDPVRFIANLSTGEMGYSIAREAHARGLEVTLISGPTSLVPPQGVRFVPIVTIEDLDRALQKYFFRTDGLVMAAAVGDFVPIQKFSGKVPRRKTWTVRFRQSPDLVQKYARRKGKRVVVGFSLETKDWLKRSRKKLQRKGLDGIVANYYSTRHNPFGRTGVYVGLIDSLETRVLRLPSKEALARRLLNWMIALARARKYNRRPLGIHE